LVRSVIDTFFVVKKDVYGIISEFSSTAQSASLQYHHWALTVLFESHREVVTEGPDVGAVRNLSSLIHLLMADNANATALHDLLHFIVRRFRWRYGIFDKRATTACVRGE
jgi:hypothetical protein